MTDRTCESCRRTLPIDDFYASGHGNGRRRAGEDEDALRRRIVGIGRRILDVETVGIDGGDDARGGHQLADQGRFMGGALDLRNLGIDRIVAMPTPFSALLKVCTLRRPHCTDSPPALSTSF